MTPKFKLGDTLVFQKGTKDQEIIHVRRITIDECGIGYSAKTYIEQPVYYTEESLELYQEPKKKKLYAYIRADGLVSHFDHEKAVIVNSFGVFDRATEYDIDYPEV